MSKAKHRNRHTVNPQSPTVDIKVGVALTAVQRVDNRWNYWRWLKEYVPRLQGVAAFTRETGVIPTIFIPAGAPSFVRDSLAFFGHTRNVSEWNPGTEVHVERMIVPSNRYPERFSRMKFWKEKIIAPSAAAWLHEKAQHAVDQVDIELSPRVLISRADVGRREIANRGEVEAYLAEHGFVTYELARMSFTEQAALFAQAEHVVGMTGAGMTNMLFSKDCLFSVIYGDVLAPAFYYLSQCVPVEFNAVVGDSVASEGVSALNRNIKLDPRTIEFREV